MEPKRKVATPQVKRSAAPSPSTSPREQEHDQPLEEQDQPLGEQDQTMEEPQYLTRTCKPLGDWWLNHILPPQHEEQANVAFLGDPSTLGEVLHCEDASKWELAMQEEYGALIAKGTWNLHPFLPRDQVWVVSGFSPPKGMLWAML